MTQTSLIKALSLQWDLRLGPFRAFFVTSERDIQKCMSFAGPGWSKDNLEEKQYAACEDTRTGEMVACLYLEDALELLEIPTKNKTFSLHLFEEEDLERIAILSQLSIHSTTQQSAIAQVLIGHCFIETLKAGGQAVLIPCDVGYFSMYKRFGMRPIGALRKSSESVPFIPMIFLPDQEYLSLIHSPVFDLFRRGNFPAFHSFCQWYYKLVRENSELQIGAAFYPENVEDFEGHQIITEGLSSEGRDIFLSKAMVVKCREGEVLITENDVGKSFGFIQKGIVKVLIGGKTIVMLGEGDIFGEIAFILNSKRSAEVISGSPDTEVVLFNISAINALETDADRLVIWQNLARVLAQRVVLTNRLLG